LTRRKFIATAAASGLGAAGVLSFYSFRKGRSEYEQAAKKIWRHGELAYSGPFRPLIPVASRPPIPVDPGHPFRWKSAT